MSGSWVSGFQSWLSKPGANLQTHQNEGVSPTVFLRCFPKIDAGPLRGNVTAMSMREPDLVDRRPQFSCDVDLIGLFIVGDAIEHFGRGIFVSRVENEIGEIEDACHIAGLRIDLD